MGNLVGHALRGIVGVASAVSKHEQVSYKLQFEKQKWTASIYAPAGISVKRFDDDGEAVKWLLRRIKNLQAKSP
jgi:hypothetical protein